MRLISIRIITIIEQNINASNKVLLSKKKKNHKRHNYYQSNNKITTNVLDLMPLTVENKRASTRQPYFLELKILKTKAKLNFFFCKTKPLKVRISYVI